MALNGTAERHADRPTKFCNADIIPYGFSILWCQFQEPFFYGLSACLGFEESCGQYFHGCYHGDMMYQKRYIVKRVGILDSCRSSSRLRGTPLYIHVTGPITRFIPAFAGNACQSSSGIAPISVHPRVCGEHLHPQARRDGELGSSPRLRGTHREDRASHTGDRFIPAFAGNTQAWTGTRRFVPVHPRVCGEHNQLDASLFAAAGSSPRLRGTLLLRLGRLDPRRFIPAFAGNTRRRN